MRQRFKPNPTVKHFEGYNDFSGGWNTETSNERLLDSEFVMMDNVDLSWRGSIRRRTGRVEIPTGIPAGNAQGMWFYYREGQVAPDKIFAVSGKLYKMGPNDQVAVELPITNLASGFQTELPIEAVQYNQTMFFATGTKLVEYDGTTAKVVEPYKPTPQEAIFIGTNALADNPAAWIEDGVDTVLVATGMNPSKPTGVVNEELTFVGYIAKPDSITSVDYKWEWKLSKDENFTVGRDWTNGAAGKTWTFKPEKDEEYDFKLTVRDANDTTVTSSYTLSKYKVNKTEDKEKNVQYDVSGIHTCRRILLHWDRLIMSGDNKNPQLLYIGDLRNPRYFPTTNVLDFSSNKGEPITAQVRYKNMLVVFTRTTVQTMTGKSPDDYTRNLVHDGIGCIAERSAKVIGDIVVFLSNEGLKYLVHSVFTLETLNVKPIDTPIRSQVPRDANACAMVYDDQYWICFPDRNFILRYYYTGKVWTRDISSKLNIVQFAVEGSNVYNLTKDGKLYKHDNTVYNDVGEAYTMLVESKFYDLSMMFNRKKLRRFYVLAKHYSTHVNLKVKVFADGSVVLTPDVGEALVDENGNVFWIERTEPNLHFYSGTVVGTWVLGGSPLGDPDISVQRASISGKCRRVKVQFSHSENVPCEIFAYGFEFKESKI